ncbi:bifunctional riboflavin kinase/FAD synthetase [Bacillus sp. PS06]|uniref:bifunctional riboflavin kinase/FAD synthetase n=1 Tax=Bacillus sp. PS06 TaxID=2764176 RepID=UPI0017812856|nr:bifunctional riboflavin kinase/FAD synthetase [Bacillus sp. PS06]MBD8068255.1 bifunctional riboflavin kinase/FAD synthetase [Bacillus sp. PS06]
MKTIRLSYPHFLKQEELPETALALGYFDGVHLGHQQVIKTAIEYAKKNGLESAVMTFDPHPSVVLGREKKINQYITPIVEKERLIAELGVDRFYIVEFSQEFANLLPQEFVDQYIIALHVKHICAGFDFSYGKMGKGTMETMPFHSRNQFTQTTVNKQTVCDGKKISSTYIRELIGTGDVDQLPSLLGNYYTIRGEVIDGDKRGRTIGFPTANVMPTSDFLLPTTGVYAVRIKVKAQWYNGVCNIGYKPTFNNERRVQSIEVHIFDFNEMIYGESVSVQWYKRIRSEKKFEQIADLIKQIEQDKADAISFFEKKEEQTCFLS